MDSEYARTEMGLGISKENLEPLLKRSDRVDDEVHRAHALPPHLPYYPGFGYIQAPRQYQDVFFTIVFVAFLLASIAWGIFGIVNHNADYGLVDSALYNNSSGLCYTYSEYGRHPSEQHFEFDILSRLNRGVMIGSKRICLDIRVMHLCTDNSQQLQQDHSFDTNSFITVLVWTLVLTLVLSIPLSFGFLWLLKSFAKQLVYVCLPFSIFIPAVLNVFWFVACILSSECSEAFSLAGRIALFIFIFLLCGIFTWIIYSNWHRVELTVKIIQTGARALLANWGLLILLPSLSVILLIFIVPFLVFLIFAYMNGTIVATTGFRCEEDIAATDCCSWRTKGWVPAYYILTILIVLWSTLLMIEAQVYIISSAVAQWYFAIPGSSVKGNIKHALKHALGSSFGTISFSGLMLSFVRIIRAAVDSSQNQGRRGLFIAFLRCCVNVVLVPVEFLNKFTINFAAITGESYCSSARLAYDLLKRNLLSAVFVEVISTRLLAGMAFVISVFYAVAVCAILSTGTDAGGAAYLVASFSWLLLFIVLILFNEVLDNVIDTIYICYAMDKDLGTVSQVEVHDVYLLLPVSRDRAPTLAVQQA